eukprot:scaffold155114_cov19-Prasinocladus_malaysianus.AAC.2
MAPPTAFPGVAAQFASQSLQKPPTVINSVGAHTVWRCLHEKAVQPHRVKYAHCVCQADWAKSLLN